jgi:hypothetical protein
MFRYKNKIKFFDHIIFLFPYLLKEFLKKVGCIRYFDNKLNRLVEKDIFIRVNYYNKIKSNFNIESNVNLSNFPNRSVNSAYFHDFYKILSNFPRTINFDYLFGDIRIVPKVPSFVKSRPIIKGNTNSILLPLNTRRHFILHKDNRIYDKKINKIVWRGAVNKEHRLLFIYKTFHLPFCDVGATENSDLASKKYIKKRMSIDEQLNYKFIFSIEGNDVASNLKWIMNSNSLCFMLKPKYETWFMEGKLKPNFHYVLIKNDFSDLRKKYDFYIKNPHKAKEIILNANQYCRNFYDIKKELFIARHVVFKYAKLSNQI